MPNIIVLFYWITKTIRNNRNNYLIILLDRTKDVIMEDQLIGKLRELFGMPDSALPKLRYKLHELNNKIIDRNGNFLIYEDIHQIAIDIFHTEYFPVISRNIKNDTNNMAIIMGGVAFNMNIPDKMRFLKLKTDDIDIKIYSTGISHLHKDKQEVTKLLSVFKFTVLIICMYLKQFFKIVSTFRMKTDISPKQIIKAQAHGKLTKKAVSIKQGAQKNMEQSKKEKQIKNIHAKKAIETKKAKNKKNRNKNKKNKQIHSGGSRGSNIVDIEKPTKQMLLGKYELKLQIKKKLDNDKIYSVIDTLEITKLTYSQLYSKIIENINDIQFLVTNKISYETNKANKLRTMTFGDVTIIYPTLDYPAFFAHYLAEQPNDIHKPLEKLINMNIPVPKIIDIKACPSNKGFSEQCRFMTIKSLIMDMIVMLSYADLLAYEKLESGGQVLVPSGFIFKYYKYLAKLVRLITVRKYYTGTLSGKFFESAKSLWEYALTDLRTKSSKLNAGMDEYDPINLAYKKFLNEFHQNLFHNRTIFTTKYPLLIEIAEEYSQLAYYINKSRALFRQLNEKSSTGVTTIESVAIKYAQTEISKLEAESKTRSSNSSKKPKHTNKQSKSIKSNKTNKNK